MIKLVTVIGARPQFIKAAAVRRAIQAFNSGIWKRKHPDQIVPGWAILMIVVLLIGSIQMFCIYLLGAYVGRIYLEVKGGPPYVIMEKVENPQEEA